MRPAAPFIWCGQLRKNFGTAASSMRFNSQNEEWIRFSPSHNYMHILTVCLSVHHVQQKCVHNSRKNDQPRGLVVRVSDY